MRRREQWAVSGEIGANGFGFLDFPSSQGVRVSSNMLYEIYLSGVMFSFAPSVNQYVAQFIVNISIFRSPGPSISTISGRPVISHIETFMSLTSQAGDNNFIQKNFDPPLLCGNAGWFAVLNINAPAGSKGAGNMWGYIEKRKASSL